MTDRRQNGFSLVVAALALMPLTGCDVEEADPSKTDNNPGFHKLLLKAAKEYSQWRPVDGTGRWAPTRCIMPIGEVPKGHLSESTDGKTHGQKLYLMYARSLVLGTNYVQKGKPARVGDIIVKEAWTPKVLTPEELEKTEAFKQYGKKAPFVMKDGKKHHATSKQGLYIMAKLDPKTNGTDQGWVYGTVSPDGKTVTSAGRVKSCMRCHTRAENDRRFGLPQK